MKLNLYFKNEISIFCIYSTVSSFTVPYSFFEGKNLKSYKMELENLLSHGRLVDACRQYQVSVGISLSDFCHSTRCTYPFPSIRHLPLNSFVLVIAFIMCLEKGSFFNDR